MGYGFHSWEHNEKEKTMKMNFSLYSSLNETRFHGNIIVYEPTHYGVDTVRAYGPQPISDFSHFDVEMYNETANYYQHKDDQFQICYFQKYAQLTVRCSIAKLYNGYDNLRPLPAGAENEITPIINERIRYVTQMDINETESFSTLMVSSMELYVDFEIPEYIPVDSIVESLSYIKMPYMEFPEIYSDDNCIGKTVYYPSNVTTGCAENRNKIYRIYHKTAQLDTIGRPMDRNLLRIEAQIRGRKKIKNKWGHAMMFEDIFDGNCVYPILMKALSKFNHIRFVDGETAAEIVEKSRVNDRTELSTFCHRAGQNSPNVLAKMLGKKRFNQLRDSLFKKFKFAIIRNDTLNVPPAASNNETAENIDRSDEFLTIAELAKMLDKSKRWVKNKMKNGSSTHTIHNSPSCDVHMLNNFFGFLLYSVSKIGDE